MQYYGVIIIIIIIIIIIAFAFRRKFCQSRLSGFHCTEFRNNNFW
jgi:hypothetical protein